MSKNRERSGLACEHRSGKAFLSYLLRLAGTAVFGIVNLGGLVDSKHLTNLGGLG